MKFRFGRIPKHYQFEYVPRFYDPEEEERKAREVVYGDGEGDDGDKLKAQIRSGLQGGGRGSQFRFRQERGAQAAASNRRLLIVMALLFATAWLFFRSTRLDRSLEAWRRQQATEEPAPRVPTALEAAQTR